MWGYKYALFTNDGYMPSSNLFQGQFGNIYQLNNFISKTFSKDIYSLVKNKIERIINNNFLKDLCVLYSFRHFKCIGVFMY